MNGEIFTQKRFYGKLSISSAIEMTAYVNNAIDRSSIDKS